MKSKKHSFPRHYECSCGRCFSELKGTILEQCRLDIVHLFLLLIFIRLKFPFHCISKMLKISYKSVYRLGMKIYKNLYTKREICIFDANNEIDELYISAGKKGELITERQSRVRGLKLTGRGTYGKDKPPIMGILNRETGLIQLFVCANLFITQIEPLIKQVILAGSTIYTDEYSIYNRLPDWGYVHKTVCHSKKEYARDDDGDEINEVHCNSVEGLWSLLRPFLQQFRGVNKKNLKYYVNFFEYTHNSDILKYSGINMLRDMVKSA
ncbi:MAG: IS1595 family transposase [Mesoflavibacter sp.]|nr:IS1595 family transposase [Mesoflavibacter sp.]